jgi:polyhydroxyalkanoate synthesis regulator phasin
VPQGSPDIVSKLADRGEETFHKIAGSTAAQRLIETLNGLKVRLDDLQRRVSGVEALEKKVATLEKRVKALEKELKKHEGAGAGAHKA